MMDLLYYLLLIALFGSLLAGGAIFLRSYLTTGAMPVMPFMGPRPDKRLDVIDQASVDGKRRLLLIRRDDVEHLIMTGGPVDVVIETGIGQPRRASAEIVEAPVYTRPARRFQAAAGE